MALLKLQYAITQTSRIDNEVRASMPANNFMLRVLRPNDPRSRTMSNLLHTHLMSALALFPPPAVVRSDCPTGQSLTWRKLLSHSGSTTPLRKVIGERVHKIVLDLELRNRAIELVREANHSLDRLGSLVRSRRGLQCDTGDRLHRCREISSHSSLLLRCG